MSVVGQAASTLRLPRALTLPLTLVPEPVSTGVFLALLNHVFAPQIRDGSLDFLHARILCVRVLDAGIEFRFSLQDGRLTAVGRRQRPEVIFAGTAYDLFQLATRREDSDTLFFQRRLVLEGDTELGLGLKNLLDALEYDELAIPPAMLKALRRLGTLLPQ